MGRIHIPAYLAACYFAVLSIVVPLAPSHAQGNAEPASVEAALDVPPEVVDAILSGIGGKALINRILRGDRPPASVVTKRAAALVRQIGKLKKSRKPADILSAVDRVVHVAARSLSYASVMRMAVAADYRPQNAVVAWNFGPPGAKAMPGFDRVQPGDHRIAGDKITGHGQSSQNSVLANGLSGVKKIELDLTDGNYRIILMTQDLGESPLAKMPFGAEIRINGVSLIVNGRGSSTWLEPALLTGGGTRLAGSELDRLGNVLSGDLAIQAAALYSAQQGGAIVLEGAAIDGKLAIELRNFGNATSYLTGLLVEPPDQASDLLLSRSALDSIVPTDVRIALETELMVVAAEAVQGIAPADGQAFESEDVVTAN